MKSEIKRFIEVFVPNTACNFKCSYCYLAQKGVLVNQKPEFRYSIDVMLKSISKKRLGGICMFNIVADGETMLETQTMEFIRGALEEGHYVNIVTNATLKKRFDEMLSWPQELLQRIMLIVSFHYLELKRTNMLEIFFDNIRRAKSKGCSYYMSMVFCQEYMECIDEIKQVCMQHLGVLPQLARVRNENADDFRILVNMDVDEYYNLGIKEFASPLFEFEKEWYLKKINSFCYAGDWFVCLNLCTGELKACYGQPVFANLFENSNKSLRFKAIGKHCTCPYCYNGISRITLGVLPDVKHTKYYWEYRNRKDVQGEDTITDFMKQITNKKLYETNKEYSKLKQIWCNYIYDCQYVKYPAALRQIQRLKPARIKNKIKTILQSCSKE